MNQSGATLTNNYYYPYGGNRSGAFSNLTTNGIAPVVQFAGALPLRQQRLIEAWAELRQQELQANWLLVQQGRQPQKIKGLV